MTAVSDYVTFLYVDDLPEIKGSSYRREVALRDRGFNVEADIIKGAYDRLILKLEALAVEVAAKGTEILREQERLTRVRPDSLGGGGPRLGDALFADALSVSLAGSVGIANLEKLDNLEDSEGNTGWWEVNEVGGSGRVGGQITGFFDGSFRPNGAMFREHAIFQPSRSGGRGIIRRPEPARRFVEKGYYEIKALWEQKFRVIRAEWEAEVGL